MPNPDPRVERALRHVENGGAAGTAWIVVGIVIALLVVRVIYRLDQRATAMSQYEYANLGADR